MRLEKHYSLKHADVVLAFITMLCCADDEDGKTATVKPWANGREHGYHIGVASERAVCFAQQRNGDEIILVFGNGADFDVTTNMPEDPAWDRHTCYRFGRELECAKAIIAWLEEGTKPTGNSYSIK